MRLAILGGSFNPIHLGHLFLADAALSSQQFDRVVLIPAYRSPFKLAAQGMEETAQDRLDMAAASISGDPRLCLDDCEIRRKGISYTVDTIKYIINRYIPAGKPALIIGDDLAGDFPNWHDSDTILKLADIIIARRTCGENSDYPFPNTRITNEVMNISSAMVRQRIKEDNAWRSLIPAGAQTIIEDRRLYGFSGETAAATEYSKRVILRLEAAVRESLGFDRYIHSRNTAVLAWDLCRCYKLDPAMGYLAGIAHDMGKQLSGEELLNMAETDGLGISKIEKNKPGLLHGRAAAVLLRELFSIHNKDVLDAVAFHTSGCADMGPLAKIVYIADKLEVSREYADPGLRKMCYEGRDLDVIFSAVLKKTITDLRAKKLDLSEETMRLLEKMKGKDR